ncbi:MAG: hypothetical protein U0792_05205 [Gemmataceae bacterium]
MSTDNPQVANLIGGFAISSSVVLFCVVIESQEEFIDGDGLRVACGEGGCLKFELQQRKGFLRLWAVKIPGKHPEMTNARGVSPDSAGTA